jgi:two-component system nitrogen regulation sensor histidine kinase NtrY
MEDQPNSRGLAAKTWADSGRVFLSVEDTGPGILPEEREKVFEAFYSTKGKSGTGLGLAVVRNVMQRHRGEVYLEENVPQGVRFVLEFPSQ